MAKNTPQSEPAKALPEADFIQTRTICGVRFEIDAEGFVRSSAGELGHLEDCQAIAAFFTAFLALDAAEDQV